MKKICRHNIRSYRTYLIKMSVFFIIAGALLNTVQAQSLRLPSIFQSGMVLQRNTNAPFWGWAQPGDTVRINGSWQLKSVQGVADENGKWSAKIPTPAAGGPYTVTLSSDTTISLNNVLIGEVWIASGQSNMQMPVKGYSYQPVLNSAELITNSGDDQLRLFTVQRKTSNTLQNDLEGNWSEAGPATVADFSVVGYTFAKKLRSVLNVPVGIIHTSWGGTSVKSWTDAETLQQFDISKDDEIGDNNPHHPAVLYNAMIHPLIPFSIRGVIWYQGEHDRGEPGLYQKLFPAMIQSWRAKWDEGNFPFYYVQIAPFDYGKKVNSAYLREAQTRTMEKVPNTGMAVTLDIGREHVIHPPQKEKVGNRLAYWALAKTYGIEGIDYSGPIYQSMNVKDGKAYLKFDHAEMGLTAYGDSLSNFEIAGEDRVFHSARTQITRRNGLVVWSDEVPAPVAVRYGWKNWLQGRLFDTYGLPAPSFRTDNW